MDSNGSVQNDQGTGLRVRDLRVFYGPVPAVRGVSLDCPPGRVVGVIGANGAGKTSLLSGIAGLLKTQGGKVELDGRDISGWPAHRRGQAGIVYVAERRRVFPSLSVRENLTVGGWGLDKGEVNLRVEKIFTMFPRLKEREKVPSFRLSGGARRGRARVARSALILTVAASMLATAGARYARASESVDVGPVDEGPQCLTDYYADGNAIVIAGILEIPYQNVAGGPFSSAALTAQPDARALATEYYEGYAGEVVLGTSGFYPANPTGANAYYPVPLGGRSADQHDHGPFAHTTAYAEPRKAVADARAMVMGMPEANGAESLAHSDAAY